MFDTVIKLLLMLLLVFTPAAFGSIELWAFSIMELGILLIIVLWALRNLIVRPPASEPKKAGLFYPVNLKFEIPLVLLSLFLLLILFQLLPLPPALIKVLSPKTDALRQTLSLSSVEPSAGNLQTSSDPHSAPDSPEKSFGSAIRNPHSAISFVPFVTQIHFFKWLTLIGLFVFLLYWKPFAESHSLRRQLAVVIFVVGVWEALYGMFEFFSGHRQILNLQGENLVPSVTGTFINRNYFAGYLLMAIPLSIGYLLSREAARRDRFMGWRNRLASLDGKTLLLGFGAIVMIVGLLFSASRMGISSLLLSFTLLSILFADPGRERRFSRTSVLIFGLAVLWAIWIGLDAVIGRFFTGADDFKFRWAMWVSAFQILKDFPLFGSGLGTFAYLFPVYRSLHIQGLATHAENDLLQLASETGLLGAGLLLVLFFYLSWRMVSGFRSLSHREPERYLGIGALVGILALMFHSLVERNIQVPSNAFLYTILWAMVLRITEKGAISKSAYQNIRAPVGRISEHQRRK
jgi:O-antigen ligase